MVQSHATSLLHWPICYKLIEQGTEKQEPEHFHDANNSISIHGNSDITLVPVIGW